MNRLITLFVSLFLLFGLAMPASAMPVLRGDDGINKGLGDGDGGNGTPPGGENPGTQPPPVTGQSMPRVMLTAFRTTPGTVRAGESFTIYFTLQNMSRTQRVGNLKVTLSDADNAFLPASGSSSTFIRSIKAGASVSREMRFSSVPGLEDRPYQMTLSVEYEDKDYNPLSSQETVSVVVAQEARADASEPQAMPSEIVVGQDSSVTFAVNNLGKSKMFNVKATLKPHQGVSAPEAFVGNVEPGSSGNVEIIVHADGPVTSPATILVTYENAEGTVTTIEKTLNLTVVEAPVETPMEEVPVEEGSPGMLLWVPLALLAVVGLIVVLLVRRSKKRKRVAEQERDMMMLDDTTLLPPPSA